MSQTKEEVATTVASFTSSDVIAVCLVIVALLALGISIWQGIISRKHNQLSVKPHICIKNHRVTGDVISSSIANYGVGPALITSFSILCDGKNYAINSHEDYIQLFEVLGINIKSLAHTTFVYDQDYAIAQGNIETFFSFQESGENIALNKTLKNALKKLSVNLEYKCIYGNIFKCTDKL